VILAIFSQLTKFGLLCHMEVTNNGKEEKRCKEEKDRKEEKEKIA
jgi:hypothetical protein